MIQSLDDTLFHLLATQMTTLGAAPPASPDQIRFQPPDATWRQHVGTLHTLKALNLYLIDLRENRKLRSNEMFREPDLTQAGLVEEYPAPARADCHYLITAWSNANEDLSDPDNSTLGKTGEEHEVLHEAASILSDTQPLIPSAVFGGAVPAGFDPDLANETLPTTVLPVDGFPKYAEFWGTMGAGTSPWKPAVYLVVTIPLRIKRRTSGPPVTTMFSDYRQDWTQPGELLIDIGGTVTKSGDAVAGAWVALETPAQQLVQTTTSDDEGHFIFTRVVSGQYRLRAVAASAGAKERPDVLVPSPTGEYDLDLT
jgi:hypothetical protein